MALAALDSQDRQLQIIESKTAVGAALALGLGGLLPAVLAASNRDLRSAEIVLATLAGAVLSLGLVHAFQGMRLRPFLGIPKLVEFRRQAATEGVGLAQLRWAAAASLEQAVSVNDRYVRMKAAAFRSTWTLVVVGAVLGGAAVSVHLTHAADRSPSPQSVAEVRDW